MRMRVVGRKRFFLFVECYGSAAFIVDFEHIFHLILVFLLFMWMRYKLVKLLFDERIIFMKSLVE